MTKASHEWPDDKAEKLRQMWTEGYSASEIANVVGKTRNAVIGKTHRLGLTSQKPRQTYAAPKARPMAPNPNLPHFNGTVSFKPQKRVAMPRSSDAAEPMRIHMMDLGELHCRR